MFAFKPKADRVDSFLAPLCTPEPLNPPKEQALLNYLLTFIPSRKHQSQEKYCACYSTELVKQITRHVSSSHLNGEEGAVISERLEEIMW